MQTDTTLSTVCSRYKHLQTVRMFSRSIIKYNQHFNLCQATQLSTTSSFSPSLRLLYLFTMQCAIAETVSEDRSCGVHMNRGGACWQVIPNFVWDDNNSESAVFRLITLSNAVKNRRNGMFRIFLCFYDQSKYFEALNYFFHFNS